MFFDNFTVSVTAGNIIEEDHYYPFGLKIAAISSHKLGDAAEGKLSNPYLYNGKEQLDENAGLNWYDYGFRNYDPQIGRFPQLDPLTDDYPELTPFQFAGNDPVANVDVDGLEPANVVAFAKSIGAAADDIRLITTGADAGGWAVTVTDQFGAYAKIFKAAAPVVNKTAALISLAVSGSKIINNLETRPPTGTGNQFQDQILETAGVGVGAALEKVGGQTAEEVGGKIIQQAFRNAPSYVPAAAGGATLFVGLMLSPLQAGTPKPSGPAPEGMVWGGDYYIPKRSPAPSPMQTPNPSGEGDEDDDLASVRFQVQQGSHLHLADDVQVNKQQVGVLKSQGYIALAILYEKATRADPLLKENKDFRRAIIRASQKIKSIVGGISRGLGQTTLQELFRHRGNNIEWTSKLKGGIILKNRQWIKF